MSNTYEYEDIFTSDDQPDQEENDQEDNQEDDLPNALTKALYVYHKATGLERLGRGKGSTRIPVANFKVELTKQVNVINEDETEQYYELLLTKPGLPSLVVSISGEDLENNRTLQRRLSAVLPVSYIVYPDGWKHLSAAAREFSQQTLSVEVRYANMGWVNLEPPIYILPGMQGAITPNGIEQNYMLHEASMKKLPPRLLQYGINVRPPTTPAEEQAAQDAFEATLATSEAAVAVAVQVLSAPIIGLVGRISPPLMHVRGRTGAMKTTVSTLCLNLCGKFERNEAPETWISTQNALSRRLYEAKDVALLIDDYKKGKGGEPSSLIQAYADGTTRNRMGQEQENRQALLPRGLLLSTGEDAWEEYESVEARTITMPISPPKPEDAMLQMQRFSIAQSAARKGDLGLFGGAWILWLAKQDQAAIQHSYVAAHATYLKALGQHYSEVHARLRETLASLFAAGKHVERFIEECFPAILPSFSESWRLAKVTLLASGQERALEAASTAPFEVLLSELRQAFLADSIKFIAKTRGIGNLSVGTNRSSEAVGFYDDVNIYLTKALTYQWVEAKARAAGRSITYSWGAFNQGARDALGPLLHAGKDIRVSYTLWAIDRPVRCTIIPRSLIDTNVPMTPLEQQISALLNDLEDAS